MLNLLKLFLDVSKAFDTVNHSILLSKLSYYGIKGLKNLWFKSYFQQRRETVYVHSVFFRYSWIVIKLVQLFFWFILMILAVLPHTLIHASFLMILHKNLHSLIHRVNIEFSKILLAFIMLTLNFLRYYWLCANKLTLTLTKITHKLSYSLGRN